MGAILTAESICVISKVAVSKTHPQSMNDEDYL